MLTLLISEPAYILDEPWLQVWACLTLMITSAVLGGATDMSFNARGYMWQLVNCVFTGDFSAHGIAWGRHLGALEGKAVDRETCR